MNPTKTRFSRSFGFLNFQSFFDLLKANGYCVSKSFCVLDWAGARHISRHWVSKNRKKNSSSFQGLLGNLAMVFHLSQAKTFSYVPILILRNCERDRTNSACHFSGSSVFVRSLCFLNIFRVFCKRLRSILLFKHKVFLSMVELKRGFRWLFGVFVQFIGFSQVFHLSKLNTFPYVQSFIYLPSASESECLSEGKIYYFFDISGLLFP